MIHFYFCITEKFFQTFPNHATSHFIRTTCAIKINFFYAVAVNSYMNLGNKNIFNLFRRENKRIYSARSKGVPFQVFISQNPIGFSTSAICNKDHTSGLMENFSPSSASAVEGNIFFASASSGLTSLCRAEK